MTRIALPMRWLLPGAVALAVLALACDGKGGTPSPEESPQLPATPTVADSDPIVPTAIPSVECVEVEASPQETTIALGESLPVGKIAFVSFRDEFEGQQNREIYLVSADGSGPVNLTRNSCADDEPDWKPDGTRIAWESDRDGDFEIWVMDADGSNVSQLTTTGGLAPRWSNSGELIVYSKGAGLLVINADGSDERIVLNSVSDSDDPCLAGGFPGGWSPEDDRVIYYATAPEAGSSSGLGVICSVNVETGEVEELVREAGVLNVEPVWSPDGRFIAYRSIREGNSDVYVMDLEDGSERRLTDFDGLDTEPDWSPDGEWLVFATNRDDLATDIYVMRADGSDLRRLTDDEAKDSYPVWAP
jgi:Tol biopolymer transport system component